MTGLSASRETHKKFLLSKFIVDILDPQLAGPNRTTASVSKSTSD